MEVKKLYIDLCVYNRPFDNPREPRIRFEADIFLSILEQIESGKYITVISSVLDYENQNNPYPQRKEKIENYLLLAKEKMELTEVILERAEFLDRLKFNSLDALHIACGEQAKVDYFITCDDRLVKKSKEQEINLKVKVISLIDFMVEEVKKQ